MMTRFLESTLPGGLAIILTILVMASLVALALLIRKRWLAARRRNEEDEDAIVAGVYTRTELEREIVNYIKRATRETTFGLMYITIDNFANVRNGIGDAAADESLNRLTYRIQQACPRRVYVSRFDGDQFLIFAKADYTPEQVEELLKNILAAIRQPVKLDQDVEIQITASAGLAFYPQHGRNMKELFASLKMADFISQRDGEDRYTIYTSEMATNDTQSLELYQEVKSAVQNHEFVLYFQPTVDVKNDDLYGVECLIRWNHPTKGILPPSLFMPMIEQSGDLAWLGSWGLEALINQYTAFKMQYPTRNIHMSLNLSARQLTDVNLPTLFTRIVRKHKLPASLVSLECGDFAMYATHPQILDNIKRLKEIGFTLAIDGVELDNAFLAQLDNLPFDEYKLSRSVFDAQGESYLRQKLCRILVDYAADRTKRVIALGVETLEQVDFAQRLGITLLQGYLYARPMDGNTVLKWIDREGWRHPGVDVTIDTPLATAEERDLEGDATLAQKEKEIREANAAEAAAIEAQEIAAANATADEVKTEDVPAEEPKAEEQKVEEPKAEDVKAEEPDNKD